MKVPDILKPKTVLIRELKAAKREETSLKEQIEALKAENMRLKSANEELESSVKSLTIENGRKDKRIETLIENIRKYMRRLIGKSRRIIDLNDRLKEVIHDSLSGLYSRRVLEEMEMLPPDTSYIIFDIDNFKGINDTYGHDIGDKVIKIIGSCVKKVIKRQSDFSLKYVSYDPEKAKEDPSIRYGGDEFAIILPLCNYEKAYEKCEELRKEIEKECEKAGIPRKITVTVGIYYNEFDPEITPQEGVHKADVALKKGKETGKNKIINYADVIEEPVGEKVKD